MTLPDQTHTGNQIPGFGGALARPAFLGLLLAVVTFAVFWPVTRCDFLNYDDPEYFAANPQVQAGLTIDGVSWAFRTTDISSWYPLTWLSFMLDAQVFGPGPAGPHFTNLLFHAANSVLLFLLLQWLTSATWRSAAVAALFALHPLHVESVAWISERKDVLSTWFGLLTLWAYARYARKMSRVEGRGSRADHPVPALDARRWTLDYGLALLFFALGLLSKPMLVTLPLVMLLLDYWPLYRVSGAGCHGSGVRGEGSGAGRGSTLLRLLWEKTPFFVLAAMSGVVTFRVHKEFGAFTALASLSLTARIENAFVSYARYLGKTFWPVNLALPYPHPGHWPWMWVAVAAMLVAGLCVAAGVLGRRRPYVFVGWFWFLGTLMPVIGLVQWGTHSMADRFTYVPLIGVFILFAWGGAEALTRRGLSGRQVGAVAALVLLACAVRTRSQLRYWQNTESLLGHAIAVTKNNDLAYYNLGCYVYTKGRFDEAIDCLRKALEIDPNSADSHGNLGNALAAKRQFAEAVDHYRRAIQLDPNDAKKYHNLGNALAAQDRIEEAMENYRLALQLDSNLPETHDNLGNALASQGRVEEAIGHYRKALQLNPNLPEVHNNLGNALTRNGRFDEAISHYTEALRLAPNYASAYRNLGFALVGKGRIEEAIGSYRKAVEINPADARSHERLADALAGKGLLDEAANRYQEALRLNPNNPLAHFNLGCVLARLERRDEAIAQFNEALRLKADYLEAKQQLSKLGVPAPE